MNRVLKIMTVTLIVDAECTLRTWPSELDLWFVHRGVGPGEVASLGISGA